MVRTGLFLQNRFAEVIKMARIITALFGHITLKISFLFGWTGSSWIRSPCRPACARPEGVARTITILQNWVLILLTSNYWDIDLVYIFKIF